MGRNPVRRDQAKELGMDVNWRLEDSKTPDTRQEVDYSLNHSLEATPKASERHLREALAERMQGYAKWEGEKLVFTDPNGTRPVVGDELATIWKQGLPEGFRNYQEETFIDWVEDSSRFHAQDGLKRLKPGTNGWQDFQRLTARLVNKKPAPTLYRGDELTAR